MIEYLFDLMSFRYVIFRTIIRYRFGNAFPCVKYLVTYQ